MYLSLLAIVVTLVGCGEEKKKIGFSMLTSNNEFFKVIANEMKLEAEKLGYEVIAISADEDLAKQKQQIDDFITQGCVAIVLNPVNSVGIGVAIKKANTEGIPVFTNDIGCLDPDAKVVTHIATDNEQGGHLAGQAIITALGGKGKVAVLDFPKVESVLLRTKGFKAEIDAHNKKGGGQIEIITPYLDGGGDRAKSRDVMQAILSTHPDVTGVFCINDPSAIGAITALEDAKRQKDVTVVGFDGAPEGKRAVLEGREFASPTQYPRQMAKQTIEMIHKYLNGDKVESEILIPTTLYTIEDAKKDDNVDGW
jgi:ribose transport system substrate-binding protein